MKRFSLLLLSGLVSLFLVPPAFGAQFGNAESFVLRVPATDDVYAAGDRVTIDKEVRGDLLAAGGNVDVRGSVTGDVAAAGGNVTISGQVGDDVRVAGGEIRISGTVEDDLVVMGGEVILDKTGIVKGDVILFGGSLTVWGNVLGDVTAKGGDIFLGGTLRGNADIAAGNMRLDGTIGGNAVLRADKILLGQAALIGGSVRYWVPQGQMTFGRVLPSGNAVFDPSLGRMRESRAAGAAALLGAVSFFSLMFGTLVVLLLVLCTKTLFVDAAKRLKTLPWWSLLQGLLFIVLVPVLALLLCMTVIGIPLGLLVIAGYGFTLLFLCPLASVTLARWMELQYGKKWSKGMVFLVSVIFFIGLRALATVPVLGWLLKAVLLLMALGAVEMTKWKRMRKIL